MCKAFSPKRHSFGITTAGNHMTHKLYICKFTIFASAPNVITSDTNVCAASFRFQISLLSVTALSITTATLFWQYEIPQFCAKITNATMAVNGKSNIVLHLIWVYSNIIQRRCWPRTHWELTKCYMKLSGLSATLSLLRTTRCLSADTQNYDHLYVIFS